MSLIMKIAETMKKRERPAPERELGMTLIEIMVVVAIIGLLMGTVGVVAYNRFQKAKLTNAKMIVKNMQEAIVHYFMDNQDKCPSDLKALYTQKYINKEPKDPWGEDLVFKCPGEKDTQGADIHSKGPDRQDGTDDDIKSWELD